MKLKLLLKLKFSLLMSLGMLVGYSQTVATLPAYEDFDYALDSKLIEDNATTGQGSWGTTDPRAGDILTVTSPSWSTLSGIDTPQGNAIEFGASGLNPEFYFTPQVGSFGTIYMSCLIKVTDVSSVDVSPARVFGFAKQNTSGSISGATHLFVRKDAGNLGYNLGVNETNSTSGITWDTTVYNIDQELMIVLYFDDTNTGTTAKMWINPTLGGAEPTPTLTDADSRDLDVDRIQIFQHNSTNTPVIIFDELRVGKTWTAATKQSLLNTSNSEITHLKIYPNPLSGNKVLSIKSQIEKLKEITIYSLLGEVLYQKITSSSTINLEHIASGTYVIKVVENNKTVTKRLIVQ